MSVPAERPKLPAWAVPMIGLGMSLAATGVVTAILAYGRLGRMEQDLAKMEAKPSMIDIMPEITAMKVEIDALKRDVRRLEDR